MRLRIVRPLPAEIEGITLSRFLFGATYEIAAPLCDLLLAIGYAVPEDDIAIHTADDRPPRRRGKPKRTIE